MLLARGGVDFLVTGNRHLGPLEFGEEDVTRPQGGSSYVAGAFYALLFGSVTLGVVIYTGFWRHWVF